MQLKPLSILLMFLFISSVVFCQEQTKKVKSDSKKKENKPVEGNKKKTKADLHLFDSDDVLHIALRFNVSAFIRKKSKTEYQDAVMTINPGQADSIHINVRLKSRGQFRNTYCYFPPVELNLKNSEVRYSGLDKIKLVMPCNTGTDFQDYILREFLTYKLYSIMTDTSFRVRLLSVDMIETQKQRKPVRQYGFFIEPVEMLAGRTSTTVISTMAINQKNIKDYSIDRVAIFNYMIGNYDWAVPNQHNVKVIKPLAFDPSGLALAVPYDFDWTGLVNASYAVPADNVGIESVRQRIFLGICRPKETYKQDLREFVEKKEMFFKVINDFPLLSRNSKQYMINYLNEFYGQIESKDDITNTFLNSCKKF